MSVRSDPSRTSKNQERDAQSRTPARDFWLAAGASLAGLVIFVAVISVVPILVFLWWFVPTLAVLCVGFCVGLVTTPLFARARVVFGVLAGLVSVALVTAWGAAVRHESARAWVALRGEDDISIQRRVQVPLLEAVSISGSVKYVSFSPELYDSIMPACGDGLCLTFGGLERPVTRSAESPESALAAAHLGVAPPEAEARIHLDVQEQRAAGVVTIFASLRDAEGEFATMRIRRPDPDRAWSPGLPDFLYYVLEHNPGAIILYPHRPEADRTPIASFLREALDIVAAVAAADPLGGWRGRAQVGYPAEMPQVSAHSWLVDVDSLEECEGRLTYAVDG